MVVAKVKPYAGRQLYLEPGSSAEKQAEAWATSNPEGAAYMRELAKVPDAFWIGDWEDDPRKAVDRLLDKAGGQLCVLVPYNLPSRDCHADSAGGVKDAAEYARWIGEIAAGMGGREAIVVLEPDGLTVTKCLDAGELRDRHAMLAAAVDTLTAAGGRVYLDCGDSDWIPAGTVVSALIAAGVARARGFSLNVAHFEFLKNEHAFAREIRTGLKAQGIDAQYIVDGSRCGTGPHGVGDNRWRNPPGVGCGPRPNLNPKAAGCDAILWVKSVGGSDGDGGGPGEGGEGAPPAGHWWDEYALRMAKAARPPFRIARG